MVARGDLGVEMNPWDVPVIQKRIVETCKILGKPVVIATQMLERLVNNKGVRESGVVWCDAREGD